MACPAMKPAATATCTDNTSPPSVAADVVTCTAGVVSANQPHFSPLPSSAAKDEYNSFPTKLPTNVSAERQVVTLLSAYLCLLMFMQQL